MTAEELTALIPPTLVAAAVVYAVVKLVRSEAAGRRAADANDKSREPGAS
jgi:hypothetical protein